MERLASTMDYFSIDLLLKTMFSLFRQDGAGRVDGPLGLKIRAFFDRLISRILGAIIRSTVLILGLVVIFVQVVLSTIVLLFWGAVPFMPVLGTVVALTGWTPWQ
ncbi:hypothetical protein GX865_03190 [Candidatus Saccharibacteria bacterium]|nr:hypothetical protein [Candidatus Saccharibacteria bacterium]